MHVAWHDQGHIDTRWPPCGLVSLRSRIDQAIDTAKTRAAPLRQKAENSQLALRACSAISEVSDRDLQRKFALKRNHSLANRLSSKAKRLAATRVTRVAPRKGKR